MLCVLMLILLVGCSERTPYGECIGIADEKDPNLVYRVSTNNVVVGVIFIETLFVPAIVVLDQLYCPISRKEKKKD